VGPYHRYGTPLVAVCAHTGTNYCDITAEIYWAQEMIEKYDHVAKITGAKIVSFCGNDCVPWEMTALMASKALAEKGEKLKKLECFDEAEGRVSGGTLESLFEMIEHFLKYGLNNNKLGFNPLLKQSGKNLKSESNTFNNL